MTFTPISPKFTADVTTDYHSSTQYGPLRGGHFSLFQQQLLRTGYLPYSAIAHAFLRREQVIAKMCCGAYNADQFHLVLVDLEGEEHQLHLDSKQDGEALLQLITQHQPSAKIGFYK